MIYFPVRCITTANVAPFCWYSLKPLQYVSKWYLIGCPLGVHQQLKMLEPEVRIWFVMWEFARNFDVNWSIPLSDTLINQFCIRKECIYGVLVHVLTRKHTNGLSAIDHKSLQHYVSMFLSPLAFFWLVPTHPSLCFKLPAQVNRPQ